MDTLAQEALEPLAGYYQRAVNILQRTHGRDRPCTTESTVPTLTSLEEFTLSCVVNAFVRGLYDPHLRRKVMNHGGASCGSLWLSYDIVLQTQKAIQEKKLVEEQFAERKKLSRLEELCQHLTNRSASSLLSYLDDPTKGIGSIVSRAATVSPLVQPFALVQRPVPQQRSQPVQQLGPAPSYSQIMPPPTALYNASPAQNSFQPRSQNSFQGRPQSPSLNSSQNQPLPPRSSSSHPVINGTEQFDRSRGPLCFKCGTYNHVAKNCALPPLTYWEQSYLKQLLFGGAAGS
jgi:hypothetical protein